MRMILYLYRIYSTRSKHSKKQIATSTSAANINMDITAIITNSNNKTANNASNVNSRSSSLPSSTLSPSAPSSTSTSTSSSLHSHRMLSLIPRACALKQRGIPNINNATKLHEEAHVQQRAVAPSTLINARISHVHSPDASLLIPVTDDMSEDSV